MGRERQKEIEREGETKSSEKKINQDKTWRMVMLPIKKKTELKQPQASRKHVRVSIFS